MQESAPRNNQNEQPSSRRGFLSAAGLTALAAGVGAAGSIAERAANTRLAEMKERQKGTSERLQDVWIDSLNQKDQKTIEELQSMIAAFVEETDGYYIRIAELSLRLNANDLSDGARAVIMYHLQETQRRLDSLSQDIEFYKHMLDGNTQKDTPKAVII